VSFPVERLYHLNGTPREDFKPTVWLDRPSRTVPMEYGCRCRRAEGKVGSAITAQFVIAVNCFT